MIKFPAIEKSCDIAFCLVDNLHSVKEDWIKEITKNISDFTISNVNNKGFDLFQGLDEDLLLKTVAELKYSHAVVFSTGTEFINGDSFFKEIRAVVEKDYFVIGHVLDRKDAYYELHHQCYVINLNYYRKFKFPKIGKQELGARHTQEVPWRSYENWHDDYTPKTISGGDQIKEYYHKCHGWHILKTAFDKDLPVLVFDENVRVNKKHHYPESSIDFYKNLSWIHYRQNFCLTEFIHTSNTETVNLPPRQRYDQIVTPASGLWFLPFLKSNTGKVIMYDYNQQALDYWKNNIPKDINVEFVLCDLYNGINFFDKIDTELLTLINLSNIFNYEGTIALYNLKYRNYKENLILDEIQQHLPNADVNFTSRATTGFHANHYYQLFNKVNLIKRIDIKDLVKPTWHINPDWT
jgi:hypothetical protein